MLRATGRLVKRVNAAAALGKRMSQQVAEVPTTIFGTVGELLKSSRLSRELKILTCSVDDKVTDVAQNMAKTNVGITVVSENRGIHSQVIMQGLFSERDYLRLSGRKNLDGLKVKDVMTPVEKNLDGLKVKDVMT